ncbi:hypothetical protein AMTR_s00003p00126000 [Amborella trichopoda]|uniref:Uncharacterized protein n=1 Tax=Amborella trichopoda TaxID=13333 RepID=W1P5K2_AMBTC|nr:hypothetical protein AMTR_s00003p00126000 [Amborella trichopoda]
MGAHDRDRGEGGSGKDPRGRKGDGMEMMGEAGGWQKRAKKEEKERRKGMGKMLGKMRMEGPEVERWGWQWSLARVHACDGEHRARKARRFGGGGGSFEPEVVMSAKGVNGCLVRLEELWARGRDG